MSLRRAWAAALVALSPATAAAQNPPSLAPPGPPPAPPPTTAPPGPTPPAAPTGTGTPAAPGDPTAPAEAPAIRLEEEPTSTPLPPPLSPSPVMMPGPVGPMPLAHPPADPGPPEPRDDGLMGTHQTHFMGLLGVRTAYIGGPGFDAFADDDALVQSTVGFGRTLHARGDLSLFAVGLWDFGARESSVREQETTLSVHRVALGPEGRLHAARRLYAFARALPAVLNVQAVMTDGTTGASLEVHEWIFGVDATAGVALEVLGEARGASRQPRLWLAAEGGYGWSVPLDLELTPESGNAPARLEPLDLGELSLQGGFFRVSAALSF